MAERKTKSRPLIFLSYRRDDSSAFTGRLFDRLIRYYGEDAVAFDIATIPGGVDFTSHMLDTVRACKCVIAVIGPGWMMSHDGAPRLANPADYVRRELEAALEKGVVILPVFVGDTITLNMSALPPPLQSLAHANGIAVAPGRDFHSNVDRLIPQVNQLLFPTAARRCLQLGKFSILRNRMLIFILLLVAGNVAAGYSMLAGTAAVHPVLQSLELADPDAFSINDRIPSVLPLRAVGEGELQVSRGMSNRGEMEEQTNFLKMINETESSLDAFVARGRIFDLSREAIIAAVQRGVKIRVIVIDHSEHNKQNLLVDAMNFDTAERGPGVVLPTASAANDNLQKLAKKFQGSSFPGSFEVRWLQRTFLNSFWIRDALSKDNALAQIEVSFYQQPGGGPLVRFGRLSPGIIGGLHKQFEHVWAQACPAPPTSLPCQK